MSPGRDAPFLARVGRVAGATLLLLIQGSCGVGAIALTYHRLRAPASPGGLPGEDRAERVRIATLLPAAMGYVDGVAYGGLAVMTPTGRVAVRVHADTVVTRREAPALPEDLYPGAAVIVSGPREPDGWLRAEVLLLGPAP